MEEKYTPTEMIKIMNSIAENTHKEVISNANFRMYGTVFIRIPQIYMSCVGRVLFACVANTAVCENTHKKKS